MRVKIKKRACYFICVMLLLEISSLSFAETRPDWVDGTSITYQRDHYLSGVGYDKIREVAEKKAYVAISNIFSSNISSVSKNYERYIDSTAPENMSSRNDINIEQFTQVTTNKVLESATIAANWFDDKEKVHYVFAVIDRAKAGNSLQENIHSLDLQIEEMINEGATKDKILKIRNLRGAVKKLIQREIYNADLRVINLSGQGVESPFNIAVLNNELSSLLKNNFGIHVEVRGERGDDIKSAIIEGLNNQGFSVVEAAGDEDLIVRGEINFAEANVQNQDFKFVRWTADFKLIDKDNNKAIGNISRSGREGHLNVEEAMERALKRLREEVTDKISREIAEYIYGSSEDLK